MSVESIKPGYIYLAEILPDKYRPAIVVNNYGNHSTIIPLRKVMDEDLECGLPTGQKLISFTNNDEEMSVAQCDSIKSVPNLKIVKEIGMMDTHSVYRVNDAIQFGRAMCGGE